MPIERLLPRTALVAPALGLAAALPVQARQPLDLQICNRSSRPVVLVEDRGSAWDIGFTDLRTPAGETKADLGFDTKGQRPVAAGATLRLIARETPAAWEDGGHYTLADPGDPDHRVRFAVVLDHPPEGKGHQGPAHPAGARFTDYARGLARSGGLLLVVTAHTVLVLDPPAAGTGPEGPAKGAGDGKAAGGPVPAKGEGAEERKSAGAAPPAADPPFGAPPPGKRSLEAISDQDFSAGVDESKRFYTLERMPACTDPDPTRNLRVADFPHLHDLGHLMPEELLADYFLNTLFNFYTWRSVGLEPRLHYETLVAEVLKEPARHKDVIRSLRWPRALSTPFMKKNEDLVPYLGALKTAVRCFQGNPRLVQLGIACTRQKIVVERLHRAVLKAHAAPDSDLARAYAVHDRYVTDLQTMICNWMHSGYQAFLEAYRQAAPDDRPLAGAILADYRPEFLDQPYYAFYLKHIEELTRPDRR